MTAAHYIWKAGFTRRWHTNYDLCDTKDYVHGHHGRVAVLMLSLFPEVRIEALRAALTHDMGEHTYGDMPYDLKLQDPDLAKRLSALEADDIKRMGLDEPDLSVFEKKLLKVCDWLDAFLWMLRHRPDLRHRGDWRAQLCTAQTTADEIGIGGKVADLIGDAVKECP